MSAVIVYADLNCPYSYALYEQLKQLNRLDQVEYRLVEHAQDIGLSGNTPDMLTELASDVFAVRGQATEVDIALPPKRPDSRFAILCVIAASQLDPTLTWRFIDVFYRALWIKGLDIASPAVIFECLEQAGLPTQLEIDQRCEQSLDSWQQQWEDNNVHARVPVLVAADGRRLTGLAAPEQLQAFFAGEDQALEFDSRQCRKYADRYTIAVLASDGVTPIWQVMDALRSDFNLLLPASLQDLRQLLESNEQQPDLILIHANHDGLETVLHCQRLVQKLYNRFIPIALVGAPADDTFELRAYSHGVSDYLREGRQPGILRARIRMMLELKRSRDILERSARIDGLTGVFNRRELESRLEMEWRRSARSRQPLSLIMLDVDHFKAFNDRYGHLAGDSCLRRLASTMRQTVQRPHDAVCRYGGEEFVILLPDTNSTGALQVAERLRQQVLALTIPHDRSSTGLVVSVSQGVASQTPSRAGSPHALLEQADQALYQAKQQCRNCIVAA